MKKILTAVLALALAFSVVAPVATSAQSMTNAFNANLKQGARGADVVALQSFLESKGLLTMPAGVAKGYFGALTKSAVVAYQISRGVVPASGYFGPLTRASANADTAPATTTTTSTVAGCAAGAMFSSTTGQACTSTTTTTTTTTSGVEGTLDVRLATTPADNSNIRTQTDVPVYGLEFRARIGDVAVQTVDLKVAVTGTGSENPATLINTIKVWDGSTVIATVPVNTTTFTKDQNQVYYYRISGLNFLVPKDVTKVLTFSFSTNSIDTTRTVVVSGYNSSSVRAVSGNGISSFYDASGLSRSHSFLKPGSSTLTLSAAGTTLRSANFRVNGNDVLEKVTVATFNLKSQSGASKLLTVNATTVANGTYPTQYYLYNGSTLVKSVSATSTIAFINLDTAAAGNVVPQSETPTTYTIKADFPASTTNGTFASTTVTSVSYETPAGNSSTTSATISNANQYVYTKAAIITLKSAPTITVSNPSVTTGTTTMTATFALNIQALGGNVVLPSNADFTVVFSNGTNYTATSTVAGGSISVVTIPNNAISDGSSADVTVTASANGTLALTNGLYNAALGSIVWNAGNGSTTQTYGLDDFKTSSAVQFNR